MTNIPPQLVNAFIAAEDRTFFSHPGRRHPRHRLGPVHQPDQQRPPGRRLDDHPAGRQEPAADQRGHLHPQDPRALPRPPHRIGAREGADPRALPQPDLPRPERLWRAGGGARLFRQGRGAADAGRERLSRHPAQIAEQLRSGPPARARARAAQLGAGRNGAQRFHHRRPARRRDRASRSARPGAAARSPTMSAAISWRRSAGP